jgi:enediyne biosynthesis protein E3
MSAFLGPLRRRLFGIPAREIAIERRGFHCGAPAMRQRLEQIGQTFASGYHAALEEDDLEVLVPRLNSFEPDLQGFAYEGAAMGLALLDWLTPWRRERVRSFLHGAGGAHAYMVHVGVGWMLARIPGQVEPRLSRLDPLLRWLALDGYGFHEGFFHWPSLQDGGAAPKRLSGYGRRAFDQGLGRCLWFIECGDVTRLPATVATFPAGRQADLWSGIGLAGVYAGGVDADALHRLRAAAGRFQPCLAQGAAFAAKARLRAGIALEHTRLACEILCQLSVEEAAQLTDVTLKDLPPDGADPAYEIWRQRVQHRLGSTATAAPT